MQHATPPLRTKISVGLACVVVIALLGVAAKAAKHSSGSSSVAPTTTAPPQTASATTAQHYRDGSYQATGSYNSPGGREQLTVNVTLQDGLITATSATSGAHDVQAASYQDVFVTKYQSYVIGKNIADVKLSHVAGSSLTGQGFNDAIDRIKKQAAS